MPYTMQHTVEGPTNNEVLENLRLELRRGCLILADEETTTDGRT